MTVPAQAASSVSKKRLRRAKQRVSLQSLKVGCKPACTLLAADDLLPHFLLICQSVPTFSLHTLVSPARQSLRNFIQKDSIDE